MAQSSPTTVEIFPVDLFFELSEYFEGTEFYKIFKDLNLRINSILHLTPIHLNITDDINYNRYLRLEVLSFINPQAIRSLHVYSDFEDMAIFDDFSLSSFTHLRSLILNMKYMPCQVINQISTLNHLQRLAIRISIDNEDQYNAISYFLTSLFVDSSSPNPLRSTLKTLDLKGHISSDMFSSRQENTETQIQTMIFDGLINSTELIRLLPSLPFVRSLEVHWFQPDSMPIIQPTFQLDHCKKLHFEFIPYSIETPAHNPMLVLLKCTRNIEKLNIATWKQFDLGIIVDQLVSVMMDHCKRIRMFEFYCGSDFISDEELIEKFKKIFGQSKVDEIVRGERASFKYNHIQIKRLS